MFIIPCPFIEMLPMIKRGIPFRDVDDQTCLELARHCQLEEYEKGEILVNAGSRADYFYLLVQGRLKSTMLFNGGEERLLHLITPGFTAAAIAMFLDDEIYPSKITALEKSRVLSISRESFREMFMRSPEMAMGVASTLAKRIKMYSWRIGSESGGIEARLACLLLQFAESEGQDKFKLAMSREELASVLHIARETLSRSFTHLESRGAVMVSGRNVHILSRELLELVAMNA